jgi:hypothetical protein
MTPRRFSTSYVDGLLGRQDRTALAEVAGIIASSSGYDPTQPFSGLPDFLFCFMQVRSWEAQSWCSGVWTYYEATSYETQEQSLALERRAQLVIAKAYRDGSRLWQSSSAAKAVDEWLRTNESRVLNGLSDLVRSIARRFSNSPNHPSGGPRRQRVDNCRVVGEYYEFTSCLHCIE